MSLDDKPFDADAAGHGAGTNDARTVRPEDAWKVRRNGKDPHDETVTEIFVSTERFIIYKSADGVENCGRLRYVLPGDYDAAKDMRAKLTSIVGDLTQAGSVISGLPRERAFFGLTFSAQYASLRRRTLDLMARAMQAAFEDNETAAMALVAQARDEAVSRRDSRNRMRYIFANSVALAAILLLWLCDGMFGLNLPTALTAAHSITPGQFSAGPTPVAAVSFRAIDVLVLGALGAFFAVSAAINQVKVNHTISFWEMVYAGFVRVPIGVIAAGVVILLISGGWILASIAAPYRLPSLYLFGFLAGFSELFVPNALKQVEDGTKARAPGQKPDMGSG